MKPLIDPIDTTDGLFHDKDKETGALATIVTATYMNDDQAATRSLQQEVIAVLTAAGVEPAEATNDQLLSALKELFLAEDDERVSGALQQGKNLSDLKDATTAKKNLGLDKVGNYKAVQAGGGLHSSGSHSIYIDWGDDGKPHLTVDSTDEGELFTTVNKPTAAQCGAFPAEGGTVGSKGVTSPGLHVNSNTLGAAGQGSHLLWNESGGRGEVDLVCNAGSGIGGFIFRTVNNGNTQEFGRVDITGTGSLDTSNTLNEMGQRVYSPNNPPPVASAAVTGFRYAASTWATTGSSDWSAPSGTCVTGVGIYTGAKARYSYAQILVNGQWINVETVS
ncbi:hypothetical protein [Pantoea sp. BAV 3049]|uniref:hypothetical protein n=1 Tax=Pantoea sp. BAV 3049 TaxID=2654188 RepID=UPI00131B6304|nr:hypothetical protein [Pantoea sp. BAV 3049]